ncbi:MucBP domain-containing protein, partial [Enterococcus lactis]|uniref:MucBP domain-containing protein n=1 Tax=Enterococcus lactis TaxID=357441 RepID=UPI0034E93F41
MKRLKSVQLFSTILLMIQVPTGVLAEEIETQYSSEEIQETIMSSNQKNDRNTSKTSSSFNEANDSKVQDEKLDSVTDPQSTFEQVNESFSEEKDSSEQSSEEVLQTVQNPDKQNSTIVKIPDFYLRRAFAMELGKSVDDDITIDDLEKVTNLSTSTSERIDNIEGIQYAKNLKTISFTVSTNTDLSPMENLINLEKLSINSNNSASKISDISFLKTLTNLKSLSITNSDISDISPLQNLTKLVELDLARNKIVDLHPLNHLTNLTELRLGGNSTLDASTVDVLGSLTNIVLLDLSFTKVKNYTWIEGMKNLVTLNVSNNGLVDEDVIPISKLDALKYLYVQFNKLTDLNTFQNMQSVSLLQAQFNNISDLTPLENFKNFEQINLQWNNISDISPLSRVSDANTSYVMLTGNHISDISPLQVMLGRESFAIDASGQTIKLPEVTIREGESLVIDNPIRNLDGSIPEINNLKPDNSSYDKDRAQLIFQDLLRTNTSLTGNFKVADFDGNFGFSGSIVQPVKYIISGAQITVYYRDRQGSDLYQPDFLTGNVGDQYTTSPKNIPGWKVLDAPGNAQGQFTEEEQSVVYLYEKAIGAPVTVKYEDEEGNSLASEEVLTGDYGSPYKTSGKIIKGWTIKTTPSNASGTFSEEAQEVVYVYERSDAAAVTVKYQDTEGNQLADPTILSGKVGMPYA